MSIPSDFIGYLYAYSGRRAFSRTVHLVPPTPYAPALCEVETLDPFERVPTDVTVCPRCARIARNSEAM